MSEDEQFKAIQEVAKTTREALPLVNDLGEFVSQIIGGPLKQAAGIIENELAYIGYKRAIRLRNKVQQLMKEQGMNGPSRPVPLKVAVPLLYEASLEEDDELQDIWARLLVNAGRAESEVEVTRSLVSILSDFGPLEAMLLEKIVTAPEIAKNRLDREPLEELPDVRHIVDAQDEPALQVAQQLRQLLELPTLEHPLAVVVLVPVVGRDDVARCKLTGRAGMG